MTAVSDETGRDWLPLKYEDGPDFCTVTFATGAAFALTVHPERMKLMEAALSAAPVAQEPVARLVPIKNLVAMLALLPPAPVDVNGKQFAYHDPKAAERLLELRSVFDALIAASPLYTSPPATPAGTPANRGDRVIYWLKRYQADEHLDDDACEELDALINVLSKGVKVQPSAGVGADEIARAVCDGMSNGNIQLDEAGPTLRADCFETATAILALLSRAGDQSNSTHEA